MHRRDERAVAAAKITQTVAAIDLLDDGMVTRDARIRQHQVLPRTAPDGERKMIKRQWGRRSWDFKEDRCSRASGRAPPWRFRAGGRCGTYRCGLYPHGTAFYAAIGGERDLRRGWEIQSSLARQFHGVLSQLALELAVEHMHVGVILRVEQQPEAIRRFRA